MKKGIFALLLIFAFTAGSFANTLILKDPIQKYKIISSEEVIYSKDNNEIWGAYITSEALTLLYSSDLGGSFKKIETPLNFKNITLKQQITQNSIIHLIYKTKNSYYYANSDDKGQTLSPPLLLGDAEESNFKISNNSIAIALLSKDGKTIHCFESNNQGQTFKKTEIELKGFNQIKETGLFIDNEAKLHLFALQAEKNRDSIIHFGKTGSQWEDTSLFSSNKPISKLKLTTIEETNSILINFKEAGSIYWAVSLDGGKTLSNPKEVLTNNKDLLGFFIDEQRLYWVSDNNLNEIIFGALAQAEILSPAESAKINSSKLNIKFKPQENVLYKIDLSAEKDFKDNNIISFYSTLAESSINIPFSSGRFYIRAAAGNGIAFSSPSSALEIWLDTVAPKIKSIEYPETVNKDVFKLKISFSEPVTSEGEPLFGLNDQSLEILNLKIEASSLEAELKIQNPKENTYEIRISKIKDYAGNELRTDKKYTLTIDQQSPLVEIIQPKKETWHKPDATIVLEAEVKDSQNDLSANPDITLLIDKEEQDININYSQKNNKLFAFVSLPKDIKNGRHELMLSVKDSGGHRGRNQTELRIDSAAPKALAPQNPTNEREKINICCIEEGSGIDADSSIIEINLGSAEVAGTLEAADNLICFYPKEKLTDGKYEIKLALRDKVGNVAKEENFVLLISEGAIAAKTVAKNATLDLRFGPNPFNPEMQNWKLNYTLSSAAEINFFVFTLTGRNIFRSTSSSIAIHNITWDGKDQFGSFVPNGVYLFAILKGSEIERGKIIVLH